MVQNLDDVDRKILRELQRDGRASFRDISQRIGLSTPTVSARVQAMTDAGLIKGYSTILDAEMLGQVSVVLFVDARPADLGKIADRLAEEEIVRQLYVLSDSRLMALLSFYNQASYAKFLESLSKIPEIARVSDAMVTRVAKDVPRAVLTDDAGLMIRCYYCGHMIKDEGIRIKLDGRYHYVCCGVCERLYREKYEKLKNSASPIKPQVRETRPHSHS